MCDLFLLPQAGELSVKLDPYIRTKRRDWDGDSGETQIWPLIKHVEVTLPKSELIPEGVVLVDIPGAGDFNSKRDEMWKKVTLFPMTLFSFPSIPPPFLMQQRIPCFQLNGLYEFTGVKFFHFACSKSQGSSRIWVARETGRVRNHEAGLVAGPRTCVREGSAGEWPTNTQRKQGRWGEEGQELGIKQRS